DNNRSDAATVTVSLAPSADLRVTDLATLATAAEGQEIDLAWKVSNQGQADAVGSWTDRVLLIPLDTAKRPIIVGTYTTTRTLGVGQSYQRTERFRLPTKIEGAYTLTVVTNYDKGIYENGAAALNNTGSDDRVVEVTLNPRPNLKVASVIAAPLVSAGGTIRATFEVINQGAVAATGDWVDSVYLSLDDKLSSDDILISRTGNPMSLAPGERYQITSDTGTVPLRWAGQGYVLVSTDGGGTVDEYPFDGDNLGSAGFTVNALPRPDLVASGVIAPVQAVYGSEIELRYRVTNLGQGVTLDDTWRDTIWITRDARRPNTAAFVDVDGADFLKGNSARLLATVTHKGALAVGESYEMVVRVTIPANLPSGRYYITPWSDSYDVVAEDTLAININPDDPSEIDNNNYKGRAIDILGYTPVRPDLVVSDVQTAGPVIAGGAPLAVTWTVTNTGLVEAAPAGGWIDRVYLSDKATFGAGGAKLWFLGDIRRDDGLAADTSYTTTAQFDLPPSAAGLFVHVITDAAINRRQAVAESDEANNVASGQALVTNIPADLRVIAVTAAAGATSGEALAISFTVQNQGGPVWDGTRYWADAVWLSKDPVLDRTRATFLGEVLHDAGAGLGAGESYTQSLNLTLPPGTEGAYYLHVATDVGRVGHIPQGESDSGSADRVRSSYASTVFETEDDPTGNFGRGTLDITYAEPDLRITAQTIPSNATSGGPLALQWTVTNQGSRATRVAAWTDRVFLSLDGSLDGQDFLLGELRHTGALGIGESYDAALNITLPQGVSGNYTIYIETDSNFGKGGTYQTSTIRPGLRGLSLTADAVDEFKGEGNNSTSALIAVEAASTADLVITALTIPQRAINGQSLALTWEITNTGAIATGGGWRDMIYLSRDASLDTRSDFYLGFHDHLTGLEAGAAREVSLSSRLPKGLSGSWYVFVVADPLRNDYSGKVYENGAEENIRVSSQPLLIDQVPPSDLRPENVEASGGSAPGDAVEVTWTVTNQSTEAATGTWVDAVWLSKDGDWDIGDIFLGHFTRTGGLAAGESYAATLTAELPIVADGMWRVIVRADARNTVNEGANEGNNTLAAAAPLAVQSPRLTLDVPVTTMLAGNSERLFRVEVPAGKTLRLSLAGGDPQVPNEIFVKWDAPPNQADFDASQKSIFGQVQEAVISTTKPGIYYVLVRSFGGDDTTPVPHTLKAELLPFQVMDVTPDQGGSARFVTMTIDGAAISEGAIAKLSRPGVAEFLPVSVRRIDATKLIAIFDLQGAPHGLYDVIVTNGDGQQAILPYRYLVERAVERDVTVGLGGPRVVPAGSAGLYSVVVDSLTNVDTPYVYFTFGAPEMGVNDMAYNLPFLQFATNLGDGSDAPAVGLTGAQSGLNLGGQLLAPGYGYDLAAAGQVQMNFTVQTYPGLQALIDRDFEGIKTFLYGRDPALAARDGLSGGVAALEDVDPLIHEIFTDPAKEVVSGDLPWYLPFQFNVVAAATPMSRDEFIARQKADAEGLRLAVLADPDAVPSLQTLAADAETWADGFLAALTTAGLLRQEADAPPVFASTRVTSLVAQLSQGLLLGTAGGGIRSSGDLVDFYSKVREWYGSSTNAKAPVARYDMRNPPNGIPYAVPVPHLPAAASYDLGLTRPTTFTAFNIYAPWLGLGAVDLPDFGSDNTTSELVALDLDRFRDIAGVPAGEGSGWLRGPIGVGAGNWVPTGYALPHEVGFAVDTDSARPLRDLRIVTTLDPALDARSFRLGGLTLGDLSVKVPAGRMVWQQDLDLSATRGFILRLSAGMDIASRTATWLVQAIDPETGELLDTAGPNGLLLPGESGAVQFTAAAAPDAGSGHEVSAVARILTDIAAPEDTAPYRYRLDTKAPVTNFSAERLGDGSDYRITWSATEEENGSGLRDANIYAAIDGGDFRLIANNETTGAFVWAAPDAVEVKFLVLARDMAGNRSAVPVGTGTGSIPADVVDLGGTLVKATTEATPLDLGNPVANIPANALFLQAQNGIAATISALRAGVFANSIAPFGFEAFVEDLPGSQGGIGALALLGLADGSVLFSGGPDRGWLYRVAKDGTGAEQPLARLGTPIYGLAQDGAGRIWATSGGGALLELDLTSGDIIGQYGDGITQAVAVKGEGQLYVSTGDGIAVFDRASGLLTPFSDMRVDDLALAPDGTLWGTSWPDRGKVLRFDAAGKAELIAQLDAPLDSLTFGAEGTEFAGLALLTSVRNGAGLSRVYALDMASHQVVTIAASTARAEDIITLADGRVILAHGRGLDVLRPLYVPKIIATTFEDGAVTALPVASFSLRFDDDMAVRGTGSAIDPANYVLSDATGRLIPITATRYNDETREVTLSFAPLQRGDYQITVSDKVQSSRGMVLGSIESFAFSRMEDATAQVSFVFQNTRYDRAAESVTYEVLVTNTGTRPIRAPAQLTLDISDPDGSGTPLSGTRSNDIWLIDLTSALGPNGVLLAGETTMALAVSLLLDPAERAPFEHGVRVLPGANAAPLILQDYRADAVIGAAYTHQVTAVDVDGDVIGFALMQGPEGMVIDAVSGLVTWTPGREADETSTVRVRVYDDQGSYGEIAWDITIGQGVNHAPGIVPPNAVITLIEGEEMRLPIIAMDEDYDRIVLFADNLPKGAYLDQQTQELVWRPLPGQRGIYANIQIGASDGAKEAVERFTVMVYPGDAAPVVATPQALQVREGDLIRIPLIAHDPEGEPLSFRAPVLPAGAVINPNTGLFEWTPRFDQMGHYAIPVRVSDGQTTVQITLDLEVVNANGAPVLQGFEDWTVAEGQGIFFRTTGFDPDNPLYVLPERDDNGELVYYAGSQRESIAYTMTGLPDGARYDAQTGQFAWMTDFADAGRYILRLTARDDGDGTGVALERSVDIVLTVTDVNRPPQLPDLPNRSVQAGAVLDIPLASVDADGGALIFSAFAVRTGGADQISIDPNPVPLDGTSPLGALIINPDGSYLLRLTPNELDRGNWRIELQVTDDGNGQAANAQSDSGSFILTVAAENLAPRLQPVAGLVALTDAAAEFVFSATDADSAVITWQAAGLPAGAALVASASGTTARLAWAAGAVAAGDYPVVLTVSDSSGNTDSMGFALKVRPTNGAPFLTPVARLEVAELSSLTHVFEAADPEGDALTFSATGLPGGAVLDPLTGTLTFTPHSFQAGEYPLVVTASDGNRSASIPVLLVVANTNRAPIFVATPPQTGREADALSFRLLASDIDGDGILFEPVGALPPGMQLDARTGVVSWTPTHVQAGTWTITLRARDAAGAATQQDVEVRILNSNRAPVLTLQNRAVVLGETLDTIIGATDPDSDDSVTLRIDNLPAGASFNTATGRLLFTPDAGDLGDLVLRVVAFDGTDETVAPMVIRISREAVLPVAVLDVTPGFPALPGQKVTLSVTGSGLVPVTGYRLTLDGTPLALDALGRADFTPTAPGKYSAILEVTDADGRVGRAERVIAVRDASDRHAPELALNVADGAVLAAGTIAGRISDASLDQWRLALIGKNGAAQILAQGGAGVDGVLATLDPALVQSGFYTLRLEATDLAGLRSIVEREVEILPAAASGLRRVDTDAIITLGGVTLPLQRVLDARDAGKPGEFGPGWQAGWADLNLDAGPAATGNRALRQGDRVHLSAPDGTRLTFTARFVTTQIAGFTRIDLVFDGTNTGYTLAHNGPVLMEAEGGLFDALLGLPYSPFAAFGSSLTLTTADGTGWQADGAGNVTGIVQNGNRLRVSDSGIIAANGDTVNIITNIAGAIAGVQLPDGARIIYLYDALGRLSFVGKAGTDPVLYGYEGTGAGRLIAATGPDAASYAYNSDGSMQTSAGGHHFGVLATAAPFDATLPANGSATATLSIRDSELATVGGRILLRVQADGPGAATLRLNGQEPLSIHQIGGQSVVIFAVDSAGLQVVTMAAAVAGDYRLQVTAAGDLTADGSVNGADLAGFELVAVDINGDGAANARDHALMMQNFGLLANSAPVITPQARKTYADLAIRIDLGTMTADAEGDAIFYEVMGANGGVAQLAPDGRSLLFTPQTGRTGDARIYLRASDGHRWSDVTELAVDISAAALEAIEFAQRAPDLADGERRDFAIFGAFADGGIVALPEGYITVNIADPTVAVLRRGQLEGRGDGFTHLIAARGAISAATVVRVGKLDAYDRALVNFGADVYPDAVMIAPGASRQLLLFDTEGENVIATRPDEVISYVVDGSIVQVTADGRIIGLRPGETTVQVIFRATEILVPVTVMAPVVADNVPVGRDGGIVANSDGYQVAIAAGAMPRATNVTITTLTEADLEAPPMPTGMGFEFAAAFNLDIGGTPMQIPMQFAVPTNLAPGDRVLFYRISDFVMEDGSLVKGYQEIDSGSVDENGIARTKSPPHDGPMVGGPMAVMKVGVDMARQLTGITKVTAKGPGDAIQTSAFVSNSQGGVFIGALNAGAKFTLSLPNVIKKITVAIINGETQQFVRSANLTVFDGIEDMSVNLVGTGGLLDNLRIDAPVIDETVIRYTDDAGTALTTNQKLELKGTNLFKTGTNAPPSYIVFGDFPEDELTGMMMAGAESGDFELYLISENGIGRAVRAEGRVEDGKQVLSVNPPRGGSVGQVRVAKFGTEFSISSALSALTGFAEATNISGGNKDVAVRISRPVSITSDYRNTYLVVERGITQPDGPDVTTVRGTIDQLVVMREMPVDPAQMTVKELEDYEASNKTIIPQRSELIVRIPIGDLDATGAPTGQTTSPQKVAVTPDGTRLYVSLKGVGGIAVVDAVMYRQIDANVRKDGINYIEIPGNPALTELFFDTSGRRLYTIDTKSSMIYVIGTDQNDPFTYNKVIASAELGGKQWTNLDATLTPDFQQLVVTQLDTKGGQAGGRVVIYDLDLLNAELAKPAPAIETALVMEFGAKENGNGTFLRNPRAVQTRYGVDDGLARIIVLDNNYMNRAEAYPGSIFVFKRDSGGAWARDSVTYFAFPPSVGADPFIDPFTIADPVDIVFSRDGKLAFVLGQRRFNSEMMERNPNKAAEEFGIFSSQYYNPAGSNIAVMTGVLGGDNGLPPKVVAATRGIPQSWGTALGLTSDGGEVVMSGGRLGTTLVYDIQKIEELLATLLAKHKTSNPNLSMLYDYPIDDFTTAGDFNKFGRPVTAPEYEYEIDERALFALYPWQDAAGHFKLEVGTPPGFERRTPIVTGGVVNGSTGLRSSINMTPAGVEGALEITKAKNRLALQDYSGQSNYPQPTFVFQLTDLANVSGMTFTVAAADPANGLFADQAGSEAVAALKLLGWTDVTAGEGVVPVEGNRNRIFTKHYTLKDIKALIGEDGLIRITLSSDTLLTFGQQYFWGVELHRQS
ncbi:putative Ig domain-containing protein, partial [Pseudorhodobacter sp.]|uniref:putative Ig domain-containing protein n=1 Tax=Pseudorhodobacter sp. TaxID=1934400 RepID=UPI0039E3621F